MLMKGVQDRTHRLESSGMASHRQLVLELGHRPALGREDFLVSTSNQEAVAWIDRWPDWPRPGAGIALLGPEGSGKSHLAGVWRSRSGAIEIDPGALSSENIPTLLGDALYVVLDELDEGVDGTALFHLHNLIVEREGALLLVSKTTPARMGLRPLDIDSRLKAMPTVAMLAPDDALLKGVLAKLFTDRQLSVGGEVIDYLVARMERSFGAANKIVGEIDRLSLAEGRGVTLHLARRAISQTPNDEI